MLCVSEWLADSTIGVDKFLFGLQKTLSELAIARNSCQRL